MKNYLASGFDINCLSEERQKISEARRGKPRSEETKHKLSEAHKGKQLPEETKQKLVLSLAKSILKNLSKKCP